MADTFFSIVIPTYNRAHLITETIQSVLNQDYSNFEIIIVDDGSTDDTEDVVRPLLSEKVCYFKKNNAERAAARNFGAQKAKGDYVNFFDSDDIALPNHLSVAHNLVAEKHNPEWFHLAYAWAEVDKSIRSKVNNFRGETLNSIICDGNPLSCNGVFVRRDIILQHKFNELRALSASEDYDLWIRLAARFPLYYSNEVTSLIIDHDARSVRSMNPQKIIERLAIFTDSVTSDVVVQKTYSKKLKTIKMFADLYIAVHTAPIPKYKLLSIKYLFQTIFTDISVLRTKAFYATIKNILIKW